MPVTIENKTDRRMMVRLNSGRTRHLGPGEVLKRVIEGEINGNRELEKLEERRVLGLYREPQLTSKDMTAEEAIEHIETTPLNQLKGFLAVEEDRKTIRKAWSEKQSA